MPPMVAWMVSPPLPIITSTLIFSTCVPFHHPRVIVIIGKVPHFLQR
jgi:hypothetical protein